MIGWNDQSFPNCGRCRRCKQMCKLLSKLRLFKHKITHTLALWASRFDYRPIRAGRSPPSSPESGFFCRKVLDFPPSPNEYRPRLCYPFPKLLTRQTLAPSYIVFIHDWDVTKLPVVAPSHSSPHNFIYTFCVSTFSIRVAGPPGWIGPASAPC